MHGTQLVVNKCQKVCNRTFAVCESQKYLWKQTWPLVIIFLIKRESYSCSSPEKTVGSRNTNQTHPSRKAVRGYQGAFQLHSAKAALVLQNLHSACQTSFQALQTCSQLAPSSIPLGSHTCFLRFRQGCPAFCSLAFLASTFYQKSSATLLEDPFQLIETSYPAVVTITPRKIPG